MKRTQDLRIKNFITLFLFFLAHSSQKIEENFIKLKVLLNCLLHATQSLSGNLKMPL